MNNIFVCLLVLVLIYYFSERKTKNAHRSVKRDPRLYIDLNMNNLCKPLKAVGEPDVGKDVPKLSTCQQEKIRECPPVLSTEDQLYEQKKLYNELKLQMEDKTPTYSFTNTDRYLLDSDTAIGDDSFTLGMINNGKKSKESLDSRALWTKNSLIPYLAEELAEHENANGWWDDDDLEALM